MHFKTKYVSLPFTKNELVSYISAHENIAMQIQAHTFCKYVNTCTSFHSFVKKLIMEQGKKRPSIPLGIKVKVLKKWRENNGNIAKTAREEKVIFFVFILLFIPFLRNITKI